jgi:hypothetical protein
MQKAQKKIAKGRDKRKAKYEQEEATTVMQEGSSSRHHHESCSTLLEVPWSVIARA